jgi:hypothetical protein
MRPAVDTPGEGRSGEWPDVDHEELVEFLESDQLVTARSRPLGRRVLDRRVTIALWALRVFVVVVGVMVIYTFFARLG